MPNNPAQGPHVRKWTLLFPVVTVRCQVTTFEDDAFHLTTVDAFPFLRHLFDQVTPGFKCETYPEGVSYGTFGSGITRYLPWPILKKPSKQGFEVTVPSTGNRRPLYAGDIVDVRGRIVIENGHPELGPVFYELHPVDYLSITLVEDSDLGKASLILAAPLYKWVPDFNADGGHVDLQRGYTNSISATIRIPAPARPPGTPPGVTFNPNETVRINGTGQPLGVARQITVNPDSIDVQASLVARPVVANGGIADVSGPAFGSGVLQIDYDLSWGALTPEPDFGHLWHAIRSTDTTWEGFNDTRLGKVGDIGPVCTVTAAAGIGGDVHYIAIDLAGSLWHTIRHNNRSWDPFRSLDDGLTWDAVRNQEPWWKHVPQIWPPNFGGGQGPAGKVGPCYAVCATGTAAGDVHFVVADMDCMLWHAIRHNDGTWQDFNMMGGITHDGPAGRAVDPSYPMFEISCAEDGNGNVSVFAATSFNVIDLTLIDPNNLNKSLKRDLSALWWAVRWADGTWTRFQRLTTNDVLENRGPFLGTPLELLANDTGYLRNVSAVGLQDEVQIIVATQDGGLLHTRMTNIKPPDVFGNLAVVAPKLGDVKAQTGDLGPVVSVTGAKGSNGDTHWCVTLGDGRISHTIRHANGTWDQFNDVAEAATSPGMAARVAASGNGDGSVHVMALTVGKMWKTRIPAPTIAVVPWPIPTDAQIDLTVKASDPTGKVFDGAPVKFDGNQVGVTGMAFPYTFPSKTVTFPNIDAHGHPHPRTVHVAPTVFMSVDAPGYAETREPLLFSAPPPPPPD